MKNLYKLSLVVAALATLVACSGDNKSAFGIKRPAPDEFVVISNQPLSMPPELAGYSADQQDPNAIGRGQKPQTHAVHIKDAHKPSATLSHEDERFLQSLGEESHRKSDVKKDIDKELAHKKNKLQNQNSVSQTISKIRGDGVDNVIDPVKERARLQENQAEGKPLNEGDVSNKSESTLKRLFD